MEIALLIVRIVHLVLLVWVAVEILVGTLDADHEPSKSSPEIFAVLAALFTLWFPEGRMLF